jgi:hypothetical protein
MAADDERWKRFAIRAYRDPAAADARRVVFEIADPQARARAGRPAAVVLHAGGELLVRYEPSQTRVPGLGREDYVRKAAEVVRAQPE